MSDQLVGRLAMLALALGLAACKGGDNPLVPGSVDRKASAPAFTKGTGSTSTLLARSTFFDPKDQNLMIKRINGDWHFELKVKPAMDVAVQSIVFQPGAQSGWHRHPGPVLIQVASGTMTFYESDDPACTPIVRTAGQAYLDMGEHAHIARNESDQPAQNIVTYFAPPGEPLRIDAPAPGNCSF